MSRSRRSMDSHQRLAEELALACAAGDARLAEALINSGADPNEIFDGGGPALHHAMDADMCSLLLRHGADPNGRHGGRSMTPLSAAARDGRLDAMEELIAAGAQIDMRGSNGLSPIDCAGTPQAIRLLAENGADLEAPEESEGRTPAHWMAMAGKADCIAELARQGASIDEPDSYGCTPLMAAAQTGRLEACVELICAGADLKASDDRGRSVLDVAAASAKPLLAAKILELDLARSMSIGSDASIGEPARRL